MYIVAIDTSTDVASLALACEGKVQAELTWACEQRHTVQLLPGLEHLLRQAQLNMMEIRGIVVATGPGGYSGLRVGLSTAKGLAFALGITLVGIPTLEAAAYAHAASGLPICPIFDATRGEIAAAMYRQGTKGWCQLVPEGITTLDSLCSGITRRTLFCGEPNPAMISYIKERLGNKAVIPPPAALLRRAGFLADLGWLRLQKGESDSPATLQPLYLRRPAITKSRKPLGMERR